MFVTLLAIRNNFEASFIHTFILVILGATIYFVALFVMHDEFLLSNTGTILKKIIVKLNGED